MQRVCEMRQLTALRKEAAGKYGRMSSNLFLMPDALGDMMRTGRLFYVSRPGGILFFSDEGAFYRLYYDLLLDACPPFDPMDKPVVIELPYSVRTLELERAQAYWLSRGFTVRRRSQRLCLLPQNRPEVPAGPVAPGYASPAQAGELMDLLNASFDIYCDYIPTEEALAAAVENKMVLAVEEAGKIAGLLHFDTVRGVSTLWHLAVRPDCRGRGIATALTRWWLHAAGTAVKRYILWVNRANAPALEVYRKAGFETENRFADELLWEPSP